MNNQKKHLYEFAEFQLDAEERMLKRAGEAIALAPKTFDLLLVLVERPGHLLDKDELLRTVWPDAFVEETNLTSNNSLLRKALGENGNGHRFIETVPKRGYRFVAQVKTLAEPKPLEVASNSLPASLPSLPDTTAKIPTAKTSFFQRYKKILFVTAMLGVLSSVVALFVSSRQSMTAPAATSKLWRATYEPGLQCEYFVANQAGFLNVWGIRFDVQIGKPMGDPFRVTTLENPGRMLTPHISGMQIGVSANRLIMPVTETSGSVWVLENFAQ